MTKRTLTALEETAAGVPANGSIVFTPIGVRSSDPTLVTSEPVLVVMIGGVLADVAGDGDTLVPPTIWSPGNYRVQPYDSDRTPLEGFAAAVEESDSPISINELYRQGNGADPIVANQPLYTGDDAGRLVLEGTPGQVAVIGSDGHIIASGAGTGDMTMATYDPQGKSADAFARANHTGAQAIGTVTGLQAALNAKAAASDLIAHEANADNPHAVTKAQVGLGSVDNTGDAGKPISTAAQAALDAKAGVAGTVSAAFQIDDTNAGPVIKNAGGAVQLRTGDDSDYASLRVKDLIASGPVTFLSPTLNIGASALLLNYALSSYLMNGGGGIAVKRLQSDDATRADAEVAFDPATNRWYVADGPIDNAGRFDVARIFAQDIGDGASTSINVTHNMGTRDVVVQLRDTSTNEYCIPGVTATTTGTVTLTFATAPTTGQYRIIITG